MAFPWTKKRPAPERVLTDDVVPLHFFDDLNIYRAIVLNFALRFDDVLDHEKLRLALVRLMQIGDWRKLGARLRSNDNGNLEYHIPASFDEERPGFIYEHIEYAVKIGDHPVASKIPRPTSRPLVAGDTEEFRPVLRTPDTPMSIKDFLYSDRPQLTINIISFEDATLVTINWPHTFVDAMGMAAIFKNWIAVLEGREGDVQPFHGYNTDPLATLGETKPTAPSVLTKWQLQGLSLLLFAVRYIFDLVWHSKEEARVVCLPAQFVQGLKQEALEELSKVSDNTDSKPFLSDGDVICAWWSRRVVEALQPRSNNRTVTIMNACDMRHILSQDLLPTDRACVSNASIAIVTFVSVADLFTKPVSYIASKVREGILQQRTPEQTQAFASISRDAVAKTGRRPVFGDSSMIVVVFSNWSAAKFFEVDLSVAVVREGLPREKRSNALGRPSFLNSDANITGFSSRNTFPIMGKDAGGNYWIRGSLRSGIWPVIERSLEAL